MAYCYNCGSRVGLNEKFCFECGVSLCEEGDCQVQKSEIYVRGIIVTDSAKIGNNLGVLRGDVTAFFASYIENLKKLGVEYSLLDIADYSVKVNGENPLWVQYSEIISEYYNSQFSSDNKPLFLFIVGGDDIIPMGVARNHYYASSGNFKDRDIDTDMVYAYLLNRGNYDSINNNEILYKVPYLYVGRLPFSGVEGAEVFNNYFNNAYSVHANNGFVINKAYGHINRVWDVEARMVTELLTEKRLLPLGNVSQFVTTPDTTLESVGGQFDGEANLYYYNMHGSGSPSNANFLGDVIEDGSVVGCISGVSPAYMQTTEEPNIVVTEACYGAKFIDLAVDYSMLKSSLSGGSVGYMGSSRIAFGSGVNDYNQKYMLANADLLCKLFLEALAIGLPLGAALHYARKEYLENVYRFSPVGAVTIVEFNLFGDPSIIGFIDGEEEKGSDYSNFQPIAEKGKTIDFETKNVYDANNDNILSTVRGLVDSNISAIREKVNEHLYKYLGIEPRALNSITQVDYSDKSKEYLFVYETNEDTVDRITIAVSNEKAEITNILTSK